MKVRRVPQRMCVGCQQMKPKKQLIRVVRTPENEVIIDPTGKKNGRGAYLCPDVECLNIAQKAKRLEKSLERPLSDEVYVELRLRLKSPE